MRNALQTSALRVRAVATTLSRVSAAVTTPTFGAAHAVSCLQVLIARVYRPCLHIMFITHCCNQITFLIGYGDKLKTL